MLHKIKSRLYLNFYLNAKKKKTLIIKKEYQYNKKKFINKLVNIFFCSLILL